MKTLLAALLAGAFAALPLAASADTDPVINRLIVDHALQQQMQNQLSTRQTQLQTQQDLMRANLQNQMLQQNLQMQYLLLQQQLELLKLEQRAHVRHAHPHGG